MLKHLAARPPLDALEERQSPSSPTAPMALAGKLNAGVILGLVGGLASLSFVVEFLRDILKPPDWALNLSIFHVYGQSMANGVNWTGTVVMLGLALALLAFGTYRFARADVSN